MTRSGWDLNSLVTLHDTLNTERHALAICNIYFAHENLP